MLSSKSKQEDKTEPHYIPKNLLEYILKRSVNQDFFPLLAKHHKNIKALFTCKADSHELESAIFIINLNKFSNDLVKISEISAKIELEIHNYHKNLENSREALRTYDSKDLSREIGSIYINAKNYDKFFQARNWGPKSGGKLILPMQFMFNQPFRYDSNLSNEENICNLLAAFKIHDDFFKNYLNVLYGDGKEGEKFSGRSFELISADYKKIKNLFSDISKIIPESVPDKVAKSIEQKIRIVEKTIEKYPATLFLATEKILLYFENSTPRCVASKA